jgi:signal transduction histidine kinase/CheY-like chemotaxis protein
VLDGDDLKRIGKSEGLAGDVVFRIRKDSRRGIYWIITSKAIGYLKDGSIKTVESFPYNNNYDLYFDENSAGLWVLSSNGIYHVDAEKMIADHVDDYRLYTLSSGLPYVATLHSCSYMSPEGFLYVAGRHGVIKFNTAGLADRNEDIKLGISSVYCSKAGDITENKGVYRIPAESGRIRIKGSVMDYTLTDPRVRMFLEGLKDEGITELRSRLVPLEYSELPYGDYTLHIQVIAENGSDVICEETCTIIKAPHVWELQVVRLVGSILFVLAAAGMVWYVRKSNAIRKKYDELKEAKDEIERTQNRNMRFIANMAHELRTPVNTIMCMDEMIFREDAADVPKTYFNNVLKYAKDIRIASENLIGLFEDLFELTIINSGNTQPDEHEYDVDEFLKPIVAMIRGRCESKDLLFDVSVDEILPRRLFGDVEKMRVVLSNLGFNAVRCTYGGKLEFAVSMIRRVNDSCELCFSIKNTDSDSNGAFSEKFISEFENRDDTMEARKFGTRLGLGVSGKYAEMMGGKISCSSLNGEGAGIEFTILQKIVDSVPIGEFSEREAEDIKGSYVPQFMAPDVDILVVDEDPMELRTVKELLRETRIFVSTANNGEECIQKLKETKFDMVFLDYMLPVMDVTETLGEIKKINPDVPVYVFSADSSLAGDFYESKGFDGYLVKPFDGVTMERAIMRHIPEKLIMKTYDRV